MNAELILRHFPHTRCDLLLGFMYDPYKFQASENTRVQFWIVMTLVLIAAILTTRLGFIWANWIKRVRDNRSDVV